MTVPGWLQTLLAVTLLWVGAGSSAHAGEAPRRLVLAHYMACCPFAGPDASVTDLSAEIAMAASAGIDGFSVNFGAYRAEPHYQRIIARLFEAATSFPEFHLLLSFDQMDAAEAIEIASLYAAHPSSLRAGGDLVVSGFGLSPSWAEAFTAGLGRRGIPVRLVPDILTGGCGIVRRVLGCGSELAARRRILREAPSLAGLFTFGAGRPYDELAAELRAVTSLLVRRNQIHMAGISPFYRGLATNARVFESSGFAGMSQLWMAAIESGTPWVQLVTWNDWNEATYLRPFDRPLVTVWRDHPAWQRLPDHGAYLRASRYYMEWFKSGRPPTIARDELFYFYRPHPKTAEGVIDFTPERRGRPSHVETLTDAVHLATFLTAPAELSIRIGAKTHDVVVPTGPGLVSVPLSQGDVAVELRRHGSPSMTAALPIPISRFAMPGNFNYLSGDVVLEPR
ncbi:endo-1,3-alpha-glucanase family glycosylhydrolase [Rhodoplanes roseus]|uniref:Glycoside hydrolase family 71 n=1 Tax=Rhodoplanes roseus TaxID=29409 RepID=A0A327L587_9BRAD|nr:endo-1,3-alpha-glucanase family glycosylhydrolase [Rhodoplanes roseus]RAI45013.1 hypothetical protein CH341_06260 [Rhodoplanes roseus]